MSSSFPRLRCQAERLHQTLPKSSCFARVHASRSSCTRFWIYVLISSLVLSLGTRTCQRRPLSFSLAAQWQGHGHWQEWPVVLCWAPESLLMFSESGPSALMVRKPGAAGLSPATWPRHFRASQAESRSPCSRGSRVDSEGGCSVACAPRPGEGDSLCERQRMPEPNRHERGRV